MNLLKVYEDELVYSYFARLYAKSGLLTYRDIAEYLYINVYHPPNMLFTNGLTPKAYSDLEKIKPFKEWILNNTMYPCFSRFLPIFRQEQILQSFVEQDGKAINLLGLPNMADIHLKYCPLCAKDDREKYGETYWHRYWQLPNILICPKHNCFLVDTDISQGQQQSPKFYVAENEISKSVADECKDELVTDLAIYMVKMFEREAPIQIIPTFLNAIKKAGYRNSVINKDKPIIQELKKIYGVSISPTFINRIALGKTHSWYEICVLLHFLDADLESKCIEKIDGSVKQKIYLDVSYKLGVEYALVEAVGREIFRLYDRQQVKMQLGRGSKYDYTNRDVDLQKKVKEKCQEIYARPARVTKTLVARELGLPQGQIDKLPKSLKIIESYMESQEVFWARLLKEVIAELEEKGTTYYWRTIRDKTNIRKSNIIRTLPYMDEETRNKIIDLLKIEE